MSIQTKEQHILAIFGDCLSPQQVYDKIIGLGRKLVPYPADMRKEENRVVGCQSLVYLHCEEREGKLIYFAEADALISAGLAYLLLAVYSAESPETILQHKPTYLEKLGIPAALTPSRANGLYSIHLRLQQEALQYLLPSK